MADQFMIPTAFDPIPGTGVAFPTPRRLGREAQATASSAGRSKLAKGDHLAGELKAVERQLGMLLRRMRVYCRAPYDFTNSRINDDADFEHCLDLATALSLRITELTGAPIASPRERERVREQVLESVSIGATGSVAVP